MLYQETHIPSEIHVHGITYVFEGYTCDEYGYINYYTGDRMYVDINGELIL